MLSLARVQRESIGVSAMPVRKALSRLAAERGLEPRPRARPAGAFSADPEAGGARRKATPPK
jgi:DNA-binding FadR family transcriptional regulator